MNQEKLKQLRKGMVFKSYKELCKFLNEKVKGGNSKKKQLGIWKCYFNWEYSKYSFIITKIYSSSETYLKELELKKSKEKQGIYKTYIKAIIVHILSDAYRNGNTNTIYFSPIKLFEALSMVNENYSKYKNNVEVLSELLDIDYSTTRDFYLRTYTSFLSAVNSALNSLYRERIAHSSSRVMVIVDNNENIKEASITTIGRILRIERDVLNKLGYNDINEVVINCKTKQFYEMVLSIMNNDNELSFIKYYFNSYKIVFLPCIIKKEEDLLNAIKTYEVNINQTKNDLNNLVYNQILENAENRHKATTKKYEYFDDELLEILGDNVFTTSLDKQLHKTDYTDKIKTIANTIIKISE